MKRLKAAILFTAVAIVLLVASIFSEATAATPEKPMLELLDKGAGIYDLMLNEDTPKITTFQIAISGAVSEDFEVKLPDADWLIIGGAKVITAERTTFALGNMTTGGAVYPAGKIATIQATSPLTLEYEGKSHTAMEIATPSGYEKLLFGIKVNEQNIDLKVGESLGLTVALMPSDATNKNVSWSSDSATVIAVDGAGKLTALAAGTAQITATSAQGGHTATTTVTVTKDEDPNPPVDPDDPTDPTASLPIHTIKPVLPTSGVPENITCVKPKAEYVPDTTTSVDRSIAIQQAADKMVYTDATDLTIDGLGYIVGTTELLAAGSEKVKSADILGLPIVTAQIPVGALLSGGFEMEGGYLRAAKPEEIRLMAYIADHSATALKYAKTQEEFTNGTFTLMDRWNRFVYGEIDPYQIYRVIFFIKDGGQYDLDGRTNGNITALTAIFPQGSVTDNPDTPSSDDVKPSHGGGSGGGCNSGTGAALLLPIIFFAFKQFSNRKGR